MSQRKQTAEEVFDAVAAGEDEPVDFWQSFDGLVDGSPTSRRPDFDGWLAQYVCTEVVKSRRQIVGLMFGPSDENCLAE